MGQKLGKTKEEIEKKFNDKKKGTDAAVPTATSSSSSGGGRKGTLTTNVPPQIQQQPSGSTTAGVRSMTLPNPPPSTLTPSLQPASTQVPFASSSAPAPASTQVTFAAASTVATVPSGMKQSTSGDFSHYNRYRIYSIPVSILVLNDVLWCLKQSLSDQHLFTSLQFSHYPVCLAYHFRLPFFILIMHTPI